LTDTPWTEPELEKTFTTFMEEEQVKLGQIAQPVRVALTGGTASPGIFEMLAVLGKERTLSRIDRVLAAA
jgi:glutamyl-tRNA synthetase